MPIIERRVASGKTLALLGWTFLTDSDRKTGPDFSQENREYKPERGRVLLVPI